MVERSFSRILAKIPTERERGEDMERRGREREREGWREMEREEGEREEGVVQCVHWIRACAYVEIGDGNLRKEGKHTRRKSWVNLYLTGG